MAGIKALPRHLPRWNEIGLVFSVLDSSVAEESRITEVNDVFVRLCLGILRQIFQKRFHPSCALSIFFVNPLTSLSDSVSRNFVSGVNQINTEIFCTNLTVICGTLLGAWLFFDKLLVA